jgi:hypothetical protein
MTSEQARDMASKRKNPGRKTRAEEEEIKAGLAAALPPKEAFEMLAKLCQSGFNRLPALALYFAYVFGKPADKVEMSGPDGKPIQFRGAVAPVGAEALLAALEGCDLIGPDDEDAADDGLHAADHLGEASPIPDPADA